MKPPIGISDFRKLIEFKDSKGDPYLFVDKSLFVKEIIEDPSNVILITRPRRFGKTLNMSLLHHFFAKELDNKPTAQLFENLKISSYKEFMKYQGKSPVIFLTFKDIKSSNFESAYAALYKLIRSVYEEHEYVLNDTKLTDRQKERFNLILNEQASESDVKSSLSDLTFFVYQYYGVKPIVLIDEYDTPIHTAYLEKYYKEMITFMREFLGSGLKDNSYLERAVLSGILRISKESLFSGLNNLKVYTLLNSRYGEHFGFTDEEVQQLLERTELSNTRTEVATWYNGYQAGGDTILYNPWSIVNYIQEQGKFRPYWVNTSDNALIKNLLIQSSNAFKTQFESLLLGNAIEKLINENVAFDHLENNESALWTLLLMSGYLKVTSIKETDQGPLCLLEVPNKEVRGLYRNFFAEWLSGVNDAMVFNNFLNEFLIGNMASFEENLKRILLQTCSVYDVKGKNPEKFYHGFILGLISGIDNNLYVIESNKESGLGRYDIIVAPKDPARLGIILEIKSISQDTPEAIKAAAEEAVQQINSHQYDQTTLLKNVKNSLKIGIAFSGKELAISYQKSST